MSESGPRVDDHLVVTLNADSVRRVVQLLVSVVVMGGVLFDLAGRLDWFPAWTFVAVLFVCMGSMSLWGIRNDLALPNERGRAVPRPAKRSKGILVRKSASCRSRCSSWRASTRGDTAGRRIRCRCRL